MNEGNYLIIVKVLEGSDLIPAGTNTYLNPFCVVTVRDKVFTSKTCKKTLCPLWDETFTFEFSDMKKSDLESTAIRIEVFDQQYFVLRECIGSYDIDLSAVYYERYHQFYRTWFTLVDPEDKKEGLMGYVMCNIDVLGPGDRLHINEKITEDSVSQTVVSNKIALTGWLITAELFRAEHLVPMNITKRSINGKVRLNYGGATVASSVVDDINPTWNEILYLQAMLPNHSKNLQIELYNENNLMKSDLIGTCLVPLNCFKGFTDLAPTWVNIYGPPLCGVGQEAEDMAEHGFMRGSSYRGRLLMRVN